MPSLPKADSPELTNQHPSFGRSLTQAMWLSFIFAVSVFGSIMLRDVTRGAIFALNLPPKQLLPTDPIQRITKLAAINEERQEFVIIHHDPILVAGQSGNGFKLEMEVYDLATCKQKWGRKLRDIQNQVFSNCVICHEGYWLTSEYPINIMSIHSPIPSLVVMVPREGNKPERLISLDNAWVDASRIESVDGKWMPRRPMVSPAGKTLLAWYGKPGQPPTVVGYDSANLKVKFTIESPLTLSADLVTHFAFWSPDEKFLVLTGITQLNKRCKTFFRFFNAETGRALGNGSSRGFDYQISMPWSRLGIVPQLDVAEFWVSNHQLVLAGFYGRGSIQLLNGKRITELWTNEFNLLTLDQETGINATPTDLSVADYMMSPTRFSRKAHRLSDGTWLVQTFGSPWSNLLATGDRIARALQMEERWHSLTDTWRNNPELIIECRAGSPTGACLGRGVLAQINAEKLTWSENNHYVGGVSGQLGQIHQLAIYSLQPMMPTLAWQICVGCIIAISVWTLGALLNRRRQPPSERRSDQVTER